MSDESIEAAFKYADSLQWDGVEVVRALAKELATLRAQNRAMREALEVVELYESPCPVCQNYRWCEPDCKLKAAMKLIERF